MEPSNGMGKERKAFPACHSGSSEVGMPFVGIELVMGTIGGPRLHAGLLATPEGLLARLKNAGTDGATQFVSTVIESFRVDGELLRIIGTIIAAILGAAIGFAAGGPGGAMLGAGAGAAAGLFLLAPPRT